MVCTFTQIVFMNLFVAGLPYDLDDAELEEIFEKFGKVASAKVAIDRETGKSRGFGFVEMSDDEAAKKAIAELDQATVEGRNIRVMEAKPKEDKPARSGGFRGGNGGGGYNKNRY